MWGLSLCEYFVFTQLFRFIRNEIHHFFLLFCMSKNFFTYQLVHKEYMFFFLTTSDGISNSWALQQRKNKTSIWEGSSFCLREKWWHDHRNWLQQDIAQHSREHVGNVDIRDKKGGKEDEGKGGWGTKTPNSKCDLCSLGTESCRKLTE